MSAAAAAAAASLVVCRCCLLASCPTSCGLFICHQALPPVQLRRVLHYAPATPRLLHVWMHPLAHLCAPPRPATPRHAAAAAASSRALANQEERAGSRRSVPTTGLCYAAPSIVFYAADVALRAHIARAAVPVVARVRPSASDPCLTTLVVATTGGAGATQNRIASIAAACPHSIELVQEGGVCPVKDNQAKVDEDWTGGCLYLAVPSLGRLPYLQWHPFSIGGSAGGGSSLIVHVQVTNRKRWTRGLAALVAKSATCTRTSSDVEEASGDQRLQMRVIGPIPAPPALLDCVSEARRGVPLLLIGGGSGVVPLVAIIRRLACGLMPSNANVLLVLVVREPACDTITTKASLEGSPGIGWARLGVNCRRGRPAG